ncbi:response regulator [Silvanigrella aquatica]|uniref:Response regulatory domain-containing protein n=1 Tax=Silvanigrella aquatica TaxID=1915309 RepID=A0A1L4D2K2_9BACT|nr:response regulator [Silvanigrella aquatica]APJ04428.1 hypothetical protein AXG55_11120 [Silvanigrella aquatica]
MNQKDVKENILNILLVEPSIQLRTYFSETLKSTKEYVLTNTSSVNEAYEIISKDYEKINLILFNWILPNIPGYIFSQQIKNEPKYDHIKIIPYSQNFTEDDLFLISEIEIDYIIKETISDKIIEKMNEIQKDYLLTNPTERKIKELKHFIHEENLEKCEEILKDEKIKHKITSVHKYLYLKGEVLILKKKYNETIDFFQKKLKKDSKEKEIEILRNMSTMGKAYCHAGRFEESLLIFKRLEEKSPRNLRHKVNSGDALLGLDKIHAAEKKFTSVLKDNENDKDSIIGMVKANSILGNLKEATAYYNKLNGKFETKAIISYYNNKGVSLVRHGKVKEAIEFYKIALHFFDNFKGQIYFNLGMAYFRVNDIENAADSFHHALASKNFDSLTEKTLIKEFQENGVDNFVKKFKKSHKK